ncbi:hypothetical protein E2C01_006843 [Portunus trituberculatus]|uniref:Uncharacterized protein n=1 Tax=Portunus trituberculatus TaxID=210409 RepID=A0A5B7CXD7_PORTR|nr:hypothetical protein [Portunus trituberculatus]
MLRWPACARVGQSKAKRVRVGATPMRCVLGFKAKIRTDFCKALPVVMRQSDWEGPIGKKEKEKKKRNDCARSGCHLQ